MGKLTFELATVESDQHAGEWASPGYVIRVQARSVPLTLCPALVWLRAPREVCSRVLGVAVFWTAAEISALAPLMDRSHSLLADSLTCACRSLGWSKVCYVTARCVQLHFVGICAILRDFDSRAPAPGNHRNALITEKLRFDRVLSAVRCSRWPSGIAARASGLLSHLAAR